MSNNYKQRLQSAIDLAFEPSVPSNNKEYKKKICLASPKNDYNISSLDPFTLKKIRKQANNKSICSNSSNIRSNNFSYTQTDYSQAK